MKRYVWFKALAILMTLTVMGCAKSRSNNVARPGGQTPPPVFDPSGMGAGAYAGSQLDPYTALDGMGEWVQIDDERYFVPNAQQLEDDDGGEWAPYQRGYWNYDQEQSWTWVSYEPFGWLTDHYGVWRHHSRHGWIWLPFADRRYQPHTVTWFDEGDYVGWYPYFAEYKHAYRHGAALGFDDGYWDAYAVAATFGQAGVNFHFGFSLINRSNFSQPNIRVVLMRDLPLIYRTVSLAHGPGRLARVGRYPGGRRDGAFDFLQRFSNRRAPIGRAERIRSRGGAEIMQPHRTHQMPPEYRRRFDPRPEGRRDDGRRDSRPDGRRDTGRDSRPGNPSPGNPSPGRFQPRQEQPRVEPRREEPRREQPPQRREERGRPEVRPSQPITPAPTPQVQTPAPRREEQRREEPRTEERRRPEGRGDQRPGGMRPQVVPPAGDFSKREEPKRERQPGQRRDDDDQSRRRRP